MARKKAAPEPVGFSKWDVFTPRNPSDTLVSITAYYTTDHPYREDAVVAVEFQRMEADLGATVTYIQLGMCPFEIGTPDRVPLRLAGYEGRGNLEMIVKLRARHVHLSDWRPARYGDDASDAKVQRLSVAIPGQAYLMSWERSNASGYSWFSEGGPSTDGVFNAKHFSSAYQYNHNRFCHVQAIIQIRENENLDLCEHVAQIQKETAEDSARIREAEREASAKYAAECAAKEAETA